MYVDQDDILSNSFLVIGSEIDIKKVTRKMIKERKIVVLADQLSEGQDVFQIKTEEQLAFLKALNEIEPPFQILDACLLTDEFEGEIDVKNLPKSGKIQYFTGLRSYLSSDSVNDLIDKYDPYGKVNRGMQKYLRLKKLNKIEKNR